MKLLEIIQDSTSLDNFIRIKRTQWNFFLVKPAFIIDPLIKLDIHSIEMGKYTLTFNDLIANDWEIME